VALAVACGGVRVRPEPLADPDRTSFAGYRPGEQGCLHGDCAAGRYARRAGDRVISGVAGEPEHLVEWERGRCAGMTYRGAIDGDVPHGQGTLHPHAGPFVAITARFHHGQLAGVAEATVHARRHGQARLTAALRLGGPRCTISIESLDDAILADLPIETPRGIETGSFRGVVAVQDDEVIPVRGRFLLPGSMGSGYATLVSHGDGVAWTISEPAICLTERCSDGQGVEHASGGATSQLYVGPFAGGLRDGAAVLHVVDPHRVTAFSIRFSKGGHTGEPVTFARPRSQAECHPWHQGACTVHRGPETMRVGWERTVGFTHLEPRLLSADFALAVREVPATMDPVLAAAASVVADVPRDAGPSVRCLVCAPSPSLPEIDVETDGPRTPVIVATRGSPTRVVELWLPDARLWFQGEELDFDGMVEGRLAFTGTAALVRADGSTKQVVFHQGLRVDPLGFATPEAYQRAGDLDARRKRHVRAAYAKRGADAKVGIALRLATSRANEVIAHLANAQATIAGPATTAPQYERAIRGAHAAVERAQTGLLDVLSGADTAIGRLADDDPVLEPTGALAAHARDLDERLHVLLLAFDAFEYTDDADRLATIARVLGADLAALPAAGLQRQLDAVRAGLAPP
jgi:hypothetical protein